MLSRRICSSRYTLRYCKRIGSVSDILVDRPKIAERCLWETLLFFLLDEHSAEEMEGGVGSSITVASYHTSCLLAPKYVHILRPVKQPLSEIHPGCCGGGEDPEFDFLKLKNQNHYYSSEWPAAPLGQ